MEEAAVPLGTVFDQDSPFSQAGQGQGQASRLVTEGTPSGVRAGQDQTSRVPPRGSNRQVRAGQNQAPCLNDQEGNCRVRAGLAAKPDLTALLLIIRPMSMQLFCC